MANENCISRIIDATRTTLPKEAIAEIVETLSAAHTRPRSRAAQRTFTGEQALVHDALQRPQTTALQEERDRILQAAQWYAAQEQARIVLDAAKTEQRRATYAAAPSPELGLQAVLVGSNHAFAGSRLSVEAAINGSKAELLSPFERELRAGGLDGVFMSGTLEREWATELRELNRDGGQPGRTGNPQALAIAEAIKRLQTRSLEMLNAEGASVRGYDSYISRTSHSADRLLAMRVDGFLALAYQHFDIARMFPNRTPQYIDGALRRTYMELVDGGTAGPEGVFQATTRNVADAVSQSRSIHFADADAWLNYMREASDHSPSTVVINSALRAARDAGLMRIMGSNPKHSLETDFARAVTNATANGNVQAVQALNDSKASFDLWLGLLDGSASRVTNRNWAAFTQNTLSIQRMAKLGFLPISQLTDLASIWSEGRYQGVPIIPRAIGALGAYFRGNRATSEKRQVADLLGAGLDGWLGHLNVMLESADPQINGSFTGTLSRWQNTFFRLTGASWLTDAAREGRLP